MSDSDKSSRFYYVCTWYWPNIVCFSRSEDAQFQRDHAALIAAAEKTDYKAISAIQDKDAITTAASLGNVNAIDPCLANGASINHKDSLTGRTPLSCAAGAGHVDATECLIAHNADVNAVDGLKQSALFHAAHDGRIDAVEALLFAGADRAHKFMGKTPAEWAARKGHADVAALINAWTPSSKRRPKALGKGDNDFVVVGFLFRAREQCDGLNLMRVCALCTEFVKQGGQGDDFDAMLADFAQTTAQFLGSSASASASSCATTSAGGSGKAWISGVFTVRVQTSAD